MPPAKAVLVVDDEPQIRELIRAILEGDGMNIYEAENGKAALATVFPSPRS